jgi:hypothetical protein
MSPRRLPSLAAPITLLVALLGAIGHPGDAVAAGRTTQRPLTMALRCHAMSRAVPAPHLQDPAPRRRPGAVPHPLALAGPLTVVRR